MSKKLITIVIVLLTSQFLTAQNFYKIAPKSHDGYEVKDDKIYFRKGNAGLILEPADGETIAKYYSDRGIELGNPFREMGGEMRDADIFLLTLINRTNGSLTFTPRYVTIKIKTEAFFTLDFTVLLGFLDDMNDRRQKVLQKSIFHSPETIPSNTVVTKFLIFPSMPTKFEELKMEFDYLYFEHQEVKTVFYFTQKKS